MEETYAKIKSGMAPTMRKYEFALTIGKQNEIATQLKLATPTT
jgi:hypothetical protein